MPLNIINNHIAHRPFPIYKTERQTDGDKRSCIMPVTDDIAAFDSSSAARVILGEYDIRNISPREMAVLSYRLYEAGIIDGGDYALLSYQPELNPNWEENNGGPDIPKDYIKYWEDILDRQIESRAGPVAIEKTETILNILLNLESLGS